nr:hypothetical protein [Tanacetum cinerariifolium]
MFLNVKQLEKQLDKEDIQELGSMAAFNVLETQFQMFITSRLYLDDEYVAMACNYFIQYTQQALPEFCDTLIQQLESVKNEAKLLAVNEKLNKENEHLKQTYKELFDLQIHTKDHNDSLIAQVNSKTVENADLKAQIQEEVFVNATLKNKLRKLKGTYVILRQRFSLNKSSVLREKPNTPRSCLRWIPTSRIFKTAGLRWIPTGIMFIDSTTKVDSEPPNGLNEDITNPYECKQSLDVSAVSLTPYVPTSKKVYEIMFQQLFDEYFNPPPRAVSLVLTAVVASRAIDPAGSPLSTTIDQDVPYASSSPTTQEIQSQVTHQGVEEEIHGHQNA